MSKNEWNPFQFTKSVVIETSQPKLFQPGAGDLEFKFHVLVQACDTSMPLPERLRYSVTVILVTVPFLGYVLA